MQPYIMLAGHPIDLYKSMYAVGLIGMLVICLCTARKYKINKIEAVVYTVVTFVFGVTGALIMGKLYSNILRIRSGGEYIPDDGVCLFGALIFLPVFMLLLSLFVRQTSRKLTDYMTPGIFLILAFSKIGCTLAGCCYGVHSPTGIYSTEAGTTVFPVQPLESASTFLVTAALFIWLFAKKKRRTGDLYPLGMMLYTPLRFFWENYRFYDQPSEFNFIGSLTFWQFMACVSFAIGLVWMIVLYAAPRFAVNEDKTSSVEQKLFKVKEVGKKKNKRF